MLVTTTASANQLCAIGISAGHVVLAGWHQSLHMSSVVTFSITTIRNSMANYNSVLKCMLILLQSDITIIVMWEESLHKTPKGIIISR